MTPSRKSRKMKPIVGRCQIAALAAAAVVLFLGIGEPASGQPGTRPAQSSLDGGGTSGSFGNPDDAYLSFSITGADLKLSKDNPVTYTGAWSGGPITLSGEMAVTRAAGTVSYVTMSATLADQAWGWPPAGEDSEVSGRKVSQRFDLTFNVPSDYQGSEVTGSVRLRVCGGVCDVYAVDFRIAVNKGGASPPATCSRSRYFVAEDELARLAGDECPPEVHAFAPAATVKPGGKVSLEFTVADDSGRATPHLTLYQGGTRLWTASPGGLGSATGERQAATFELSKSLVGPLFFCVWASDPAGNSSAGSPKSSCAWLKLLVPIERVSNGCGGKGWETIVAIQNYLGNAHTYVDSLINPLAKSYTVNFKEACDLHDAGYGGQMVYDQINKRRINYRGWPRKAVDKKFRRDMMTLCNRKLRTAPVARRKCLGKGGPLAIGSTLLFRAVRDYGHLFFDADLTVPGVQDEASDPEAQPPGGARGNR